MQLDTLLEVVTPQLFAHAYAEPGSIISQEGEVFCEFANLGRLRIHAGGFVADNIYNSTFKAGSVIDIKAMMRTNASGWETTYREAVGAVVRKFKTILPAGFTDQLNIDRMAEDALNRRRVFNACVCKSRSLSDLPGGLALRTNNDLASLLSIGGVSYLSSYDIQSLEAKLRKLGVNAKLPKVSVLLIPYFSNVYTISCIELIFGKRNSSNMVIWLDDKEVAISGLLGLGESYNCFLESNLGDALSDMRKSIEDKSVFFSAMINPDGAGVGWIPSKFLYVRRDDNPLSLITPTHLVRNGATCVVTNYPSLRDSAIMGNSMSWGDAVADSVVRLLEEYDSYTPQVQLLLRTVRTERNIKIRIKERLEAIGKFVLSDQLEVELRDGIIWEDTQGALYSTASGYLWEEPGSRKLGGTLVSNFTIQPNYSVRYDTGELYKAMTVTVGGETRELLLSPSSMDTVKKFSERVEEAIALSGNPTLISPAIFDFLHGRPIITWLMRCYSELPIRLGSSYIGWNATRTKFIGTGFYVQDGDIVSAECMYRPGVEYLKYFAANGSKLSKTPMAEGIPMDLMKLIWQCAGIIMRSYSGHVLTPVEYVNDKGTRETMQRIFYNAGQTGIVQLNKNMRAMGDIDYIQGYPYVAQGYNRSQAKACKAGMILLGEEGIQLDAFTPEAEMQAGQYLRYVIETLPAYLIKNCGPSFVPDVGVIPPRVLEGEGKKIIDEMELYL